MVLTTNDIGAKTNDAKIMTKTNKWIIAIEWAIIIGIFVYVIMPDWNKMPTTKDYFALLIIGELIIESWSRLKYKI